MTDHVECVVVGAGVVGLAVARALAREGRDVVLLEAEDGIGRGASSRNSEVVHAGLYYPQGSLKARTCVAGREALYEYCESHGVAHRRLGKLVVATQEDEVPRLEAVAARAAANGVDDLEWLDAGGVEELEPELRAVAGLHSPSSGIVDSHGLMESFRRDFEVAGGAIAFRTRVTGGAVDEMHLILDVDDGVASRLRADVVVNAAGAGAHRLALSLRGLDPAVVPEITLVKGSYFGCRAPSPFDRLVYPVPSREGLGVHVTLDLAGALRFGPDAEPVEGACSLDVDPARADAFHDAIRRYWPGLPGDSLVPAYAGLRTKARRSPDAEPDFVIQDETQHGVKGLIQMFGIESPGLTAALALADIVADR